MYPGSMRVVHVARLHERGPLTRLHERGPRNRAT